MRGCVLAAFVAVGCGGKVEQEEFSISYVDHYCDVWVACGGASATAVFDGNDTKEDCVAIEGPRITEAWLGCEYKPRRARQCLEELPDPVCPATGEPADAFPLICAEVFDACLGG